MRTVDWRTLWEEHAEPGQLRRVLCALSVSMGGDGGQSTNCSPSMPRIGRRAGMRRDAASKWLRVAEEEGWVNVGRVTGLRNRYYATVPSELKLKLQRIEELHAEPKKPQQRKFTRRKAGKAEAHECPRCGGAVKKGTNRDSFQHYGREPVWVCSSCSWWNVDPPQAG